MTTTFRNRRRRAERERGNIVPEEGEKREKEKESRVTSLVFMMTERS